MENFDEVFIFNEIKLRRLSVELRNRNRTDEV